MVPGGWNGCGYTLKTSGYGWHDDCNGEQCELAVGLPMCVYMYWDFSAVVSTS